MNEPQYYVAGGVRRSVRRPGSRGGDAAAVLYRDGFPPTPLDVPLSALHVPHDKSVVSRSHPRYRRVERELPQILAGTLVGTRSTCSCSAPAVNPLPSPSPE